MCISRSSLSPGIKPNFLYVALNDYLVRFCVCLKIFKKNSIENKYSIFLLLYVLFLINSLCFRIAKISKIIPEILKIMFLNSASNIFELATHFKFSKVSVTFHNFWIEINKIGGFFNYKTSMLNISGLAKIVISKMVWYRI